MTDVARRYGVARQTVHGWLRRYANDGGLGGLADLSSRPDSCPRRMPAANERAHLTGRHHLVIILAAALRRAFPHVPFFAAAASQVSCLVEMAADDAAARRAHRLTLADALLTLAAARVPAGALGAGGTAGAQRIQRLIDSPRPASRGRRLVTSAAALIAAPAVAFSAPALALVYISHCPPAASHSHLASSTRQPARGAAAGSGQASRG